MASLTINSKSASEAPKNIIKSAKTVSDLKEMYSVGKIIGNGGSSVVRIVKNKKSDTLRAMKIIDKRYIEDKSRLELEVSIQLNLSHPSIVKLYDVFESPNEIFIVMEYMRGGELYDVMVEKDKFIEAEVKVASRQVLEAIKHMHSKGVIHRDIKPENILMEIPFSTDLSKIRAKVSDFGSSRYLMDKAEKDYLRTSEEFSRLSTTDAVGSTSFTGSLPMVPPPPSGASAKEVLTAHVHQKPRRHSRTEQLRNESGDGTKRRRAFSAVFTDYFVAPEVLLGKGYDSAVDMWSMGVVLYILLCGFPPFFEDSSGNLETVTSLKERIRSGHFDFPSPYWDEISENAKHLVRRMLTVDPRRRIKAKDALHHPFFNARTPSMDELQLNFKQIHLQKKIQLQDGNSSPGSEKRRKRSPTLQYEDGGEEEGANDQGGDSPKASAAALQGGASQEEIEASARLVEAVVNDLVGSGRSAVQENGGPRRAFLVEEK